MPCKPHLAEHLARLVLGLLVADPALDHRAEGHVLEHREPGEKRAVLEDHDAVGTGGRLLVRVAEHLAVEKNLARGDAVEAGDGVEQGGLAAARRPHDHAELAGLDFHGAVVHGQNLGAVRIVDLGDVRMEICAAA